MTTQREMMYRQLEFIRYNADQALFHLSMLGNFEDEAKAPRIVQANEAVLARLNGNGAHMLNAGSATAASIDGAKKAVGNHLSAIFGHSGILHATVQPPAEGETTGVGNDAS